MNYAMNYEQRILNRSPGWKSDSGRAALCAIAAEADAEIERLRAALAVAVHDLKVLQDEADAKPQKPFAQYGQCDTCGIFSDSARALHDAKRACRGDES